MALGKGLDALFESGGILSEDKKELREIKLSMIEPRKDQPRKNFDKEQLSALSESIELHGVIQPIIVVESKNGYYSIIAGERRWRAAKMAGLEKIPAIVKDLDELKAAEISLVENLQRENLNPFEEALGYQSLMEQFGLTQEEVSEKVGKSRPFIANMLRLLQLDDYTKEALSSGKISTGHARALLSIEDKKIRHELCDEAIKGNLTVRDIEEASKQKKKVAKHKQNKNPYPDVSESLTKKFGTKVKIIGTEKKGKLEINYCSAEDLTRIVDLL